MCMSEAGENGDDKSESLAGSGSSSSEHVCPSERVGKRRLLNGERVGDSLALEYLTDWLRYAEVSEGSGALVERRWCHG
jgi:hypothetical protein